jgi:hypothetical protein
MMCVGVVDCVGREVGNGHDVHCVSVGVLCGDVGTRAEERVMKEVGM